MDEYLEIPKVSIIVPVYQVEKYIEQCITSLVNQTLKGIEIIVIDDCGNDRSMEIVEKISQEDSRIRILRMNKNSGLSSARNAGLEIVRAPYVMFCDSDDYYHQEMCEQMYHCMEENQVDAAVCEPQLFTEHSGEIVEIEDKYFNVKSDGVGLLDDDSVMSLNAMVWNKIFRTELIRNHQVRFPDGLKFEDIYFSNSYFCWASKIYYLPKRLYYYRQRNDSIMGKLHQGETAWSLDHLRIVMKFYDYLCTHHLLEKKKTLVQRLFIDMLQLTLTYEKGIEGKKAACELASEWLNKSCWGINDFPKSLQRVVDMLIHNKLIDNRISKVFGLLKWNRTIKKEVISFCYIPLWKIKYSYTGKKRYLLGIICINKEKFDNIEH